MKSRDLIAKEKCNVTSIYSSLDSKKGKSYNNGIFIKELFTNTSIYDLTEKKINDIFNKILDSELFGTNSELELNKKLLTDRLIRYKKYQESFKSDEKILKKGGAITINKYSEPISIEYNFIIKNEKTGMLEVCRIKNKKCNLKKGGRTIHTKIAESLELYLLQLVGEELYPTEKVCGSIIFLASDADTTGKADGDFNIDKLVNIVKHHFEDKAIMNERIINTLDDTIPKTNSCKSTDCDNCQFGNICNYIHKDVSKLVVIPPVAKATGKVVFTEAQQSFIDIIKGLFMVLAGAGSGKTTVIANHFAKLIENRVKPSDILLITYTDKGAIEIKEKIVYWLNQKGISVPIDKLNVFTFNSFGYNLIKKEFKRFGFTKVPEVIDKLTKIDIIKDISERHPRLDCLNYVNPFMSLFHANGAIIELCEMFDTIKAQGFIYPSELQDYYESKNISDDDALEVIKMNKEYNKILKENNLIEFADQISNMYNLLSDKEMLKKYGYAHIIVDEFQDTDLIQMNILSLFTLYPFFVSLCVCGDESQSIYSWRGAEQTNILNFDKYFKNVKRIEMLENFRSTEEICKLANNIDSINKFSTRKKISSSRSGKKPLLYEGDLELIANNVSQAINDGFKPEQIAIIARTKSSLLKVQNLLEVLNIPSIMAVSELLIDNPKIKNIIGFSNFLYDNTLDLHFAEFLQIYKYKEFTEATDIISFIKNEKIIFLDEYDKCESDEDKLEYVYSLLRPMMKEDKAVAKLIEICNDKKFSTVKDFRDFLNKLKTYKSDYYIEKSEEKYEAVTLTTAHSSKGREFDKVYLYLDKFKYPKANMYDTDKNNFEVEEERRLLYVGITRAKNELDIISNAKNSSIYKEIELCINIK